MTARHAANPPRGRLRRAILPIVAGLAAVGLAIGLVVLDPNDARAADPVGLGKAAAFSVLAASTATNAGSSALEQDLGVSPGNTTPGFPAEVVTHPGDATASQAQHDLTAAYNDAAGRTPHTDLAPELGGRTLIPGVYRIGSAKLTGQLTLDAQNDPLAVWIFQIDSTLVTAADSSVNFVNGSVPCNVYWQVGSSTTIGAGSDFVGNIMSLASITMTTGATLTGRALTRTESVTLDSNVITEPRCSAPTSSPTGSPSAEPTVAQPVSLPEGQAPNPPQSPKPPLPVTGDRLVPILAGVGTTMVLVGVVLVFLFRRPHYQPSA